MEWKKVTDEYYSTGYVWGKYWGGGEGGYKAENLGPYDTLAELEADATAMVKSGSLDSGMGYESLIGALLLVTHTRTIEVEGEHWTNEQSEMIEIGNLTEEASELLWEVV